MVLELGQLTEKMKWVPIREGRNLACPREDHWSKVIVLQCEYNNL